MTTILAIEQLGSLISVGINALLSAQRYQLLIEAARKEGREITDEELAELKAENDELTKNVLDMLR